MNPSDAFHRILESLHEAALDDAHWPTAAALIEEACGCVGNMLVVGERFGDEVRVTFSRYLARGEPRQDLMRNYFEVYASRDEMPLRLLRRPLGALKPHPRPVHRKGTEDVARVQRAPAPQRSSERPGCAPGRAGQPPCRMVSRRSCRQRRLAVRPRPANRVPGAACPPTRPRTSGSGRRRCAERRPGRPAGHQRDRRPAPRPWRPRAGGERSCPGDPARQQGAV